MSGGHRGLPARLPAHGKRRTSPSSLGRCYSNQRSGAEPYACHVTSPHATSGHIQLQAFRWRPREVTGPLPLCGAKCNLSQTQGLREICPPDPGVTRREGRACAVRVPTAWVPRPLAAGPVPVRGLSGGEQRAGERSFPTAGTTASARALDSHRGTGPRCQKGWRPSPAWQSNHLSPQPQRRTCGTLLCCCSERPQAWP